MDERMRFVIRLKDGETMASLCREFSISRKTGYKIFERRLPHAIKTPAASTVHAVLDRHGLVKPMGRRRSRAGPRSTLLPAAPI
jgi:hypothetical protein